MRELRIYEPSGGEQIFRGTIAQYLRLMIVNESVQQTAEDLGFIKPQELLEKGLEFGPEDLLLQSAFAAGRTLSVPVKANRAQFNNSPDLARLFVWNVLGKAIEYGRKGGIFTGEERLEVIELRLDVPPGLSRGKKNIAREWSLVWRPALVLYMDYTTAARAARETLNIISNLLELIGGVTQDQPDVALFTSRITHLREIASHFINELYNDAHFDTQGEELALALSTIQLLTEAENLDLVSLRVRLESLGARIQEIYARVERERGYSSANSLPPVPPPPQIPAAMQKLIERGILPPLN